MIPIQTTYFCAISLSLDSTFVFILVTTQQSILFTLRHRRTDLGLPRVVPAEMASPAQIPHSLSVPKSKNKSPNVTISLLSSL